ncbi:hypothetical protein L596_016232 [Steinernema carpocapsae]|uniref:Uncharacterized protein n=1 Tax=Steinernema carpocapsae TaxID=34508 RepID=A0A4V6A3C6_STECR|nr:hypothetical protein L596_016232 [Steinernema carpocapsae]
MSQNAAFCKQNSKSAAEWNLFHLESSSPLLPAIILAASNSIITPPRAHLQNLFFFALQKVPFRHFVPLFATLFAQRIDCTQQRRRSPVEPYAVLGTRDGSSVGRKMIIFYARRLPEDSLVRLEGRRFKAAQRGVHTFTLITRLCISLGRRRL